MRPFVLGVLTALSVLFGAATQAVAANSAVVLMYHRFGESGTPSTNIRLDQFEAHLRVIKEGGFTVLPLPEILAALRTKRALPDRTIGLSVDDAFLSVYTNAWPRLRAANLPFTLFVATDAVDDGNRDYMSWNQIRDLARSGVTIGSQTAAHLHMPVESEAVNKADIEKSNRRFEQELGRRPRLFAYPYGEMSLTARDIVKDAGFTAAFGQHSGVLHQGSRFYFLPRFAMNEVYGNADRFRLAANALPLEVREVTPADPFLLPRDNPPYFGFTVFGDALSRIDMLACYASGQGKARIERLGASRIEVRMNKAFGAGRARINCTMPAKDRRWRWYGMQFFVPR